MVITDERVQIDWHWPLPGAHSIMMVNSAQSGEVGGAPPPLSLYLLYLTSKVVLYDMLQLRGQIRSCHFSSNLFSTTTLRLINLAGRTLYIW